MSKKRKREVDVELVKVYEELTDNDENIRLKAAHTLVSKIFKPGVTNDEQTITILTRLFRGLCSSRKAARLGFSVALTELLSQVSLDSTGSTNPNLSLSAIIDIFEAQTTPEGGASGQDERDHYFGRVFGADAVLKSGVLFKTSEPTQWKRLLNLICGVATKKPWLRQECGWVLFVCITSDHRKDVLSNFAVMTIETLAENKLIRTPEGVAIWLAATRGSPQSPKPKSMWKNGDPLAKSDVHVLASILKDARTQPDQTDADSEAQGSARWSANLHFAWDIVLSEVCRETHAKRLDTGNGRNETSKSVTRVPFDLFWRVVVDEGLFSPSSSTERKAWGFSIWRKAFETCPRDLLRYTFTPQATSCLVNSLKSSERFLQKCALRASQIFHTGLTASDADAPDQGLTGACFRTLLESVSYGDFDHITKSKTIQSLIDIDDLKVLRAISLTLAFLARKSIPEEDDKSLLARQRTLIALQSKVVFASFRRMENKEPTDEAALDHDGTQVARTILSAWIRGVCTLPSPGISKPGDFCFKPELLPEAREFVRERLALGFEQALKLGAMGCGVLQTTVFEIRLLEKDHESMSIVFESDIKGLVQEAWRRLTKITTSFGKQQPIAGDQSVPQNIGAKAEQIPRYEGFPTLSDGLYLLYCLVLFQIYTGETDAVQILQDLLECHDRWHASREEKLSTGEHLDSSEAIVEILLSFASRPSKFLRRITIQIFEAFARQMTSNGLHSLCRILAAKENTQGQQEIFQVEDINMDGAEESRTNSGEEEIDSDVEVGSASSAEDTSSENSASTSESSNVDDDSEEDTGSSEREEDDDELAVFDAALASALGTRRLDENDLAAGLGASDSSTDADMDDDEMMELDSKLAEVFRARNEQQSKNKKKEAKEAKEVVVNFKNRVLDLVESYLKHQQQNLLTIDLIVPLLTLARTTSTKQLAERACNILQQFCSRCKGSNIPRLGSQIDHATEVLRSIHEEAGLESSNAHSHMTSQTSLLVVKVLVNAHPDNVKTAVGIYMATRVKQLTKKDCRVRAGFFTDWNNWCQTAREKLAQ
ncbi:uncharacterized protein Z518_04483 [Rhinocladiella mackenziei CBS 650.93]|uniref:DNA polymerase V n=1 Tax=Rhinocladiella mackenziei CBS 650.93 TaxID=1442369 RepID=A0A0D2FWG5_9EURO|nr:uncharacterized protein Z518_04483 [Rhinocladiella mackenziei CBS 650.93]KIX06507.1 hypothetical protein Z518_04483 [Rhinocladiella mackenziei CBS 650.93]